MLKKQFMSNNSKTTKNVCCFITKEKYDLIEDCECGGPVFKYHDTTKNVFVAKCGYFSKVMEIDKKTKKITWVDSKKPACDWICKYNGERPVFSEINSNLNKYIEKTTKDPHKQLEEKLKLLFKFLYVSNHTSTLDEINVLVKNNLYREPRKTFYYPSIGLSMRVSHYEPFDEYEKRIFSKKIIDVSSILYEKHLARKAELEKKESLQRKKSTPRKKEAELVEEPVVSQFIVVDSDSEQSDSEQSDSENENEISDTENSETEQEENDNTEEQDDTEEPFIEEETEVYDDDYGEDEVDYYDD